MYIIDGNMMKINKGTSNRTNLYGTKRKETIFKNSDEQRRSIYSQTLKPHKKGINGPTTHRSIATDRSSIIKQENSKNKSNIKGNAVTKTNKWQ